MKWIRVAAAGFLLAVCLASLLGNVVAPASWARQLRDQPDAGPSRAHWLGTDDLGRDQLARLLYGTRVSLFLAPAAAALACLLAALVGGVAGLAGGWIESGIMAATDLFLSMPWLFLLVTVRALLPLDVSPWISVLITFALLGCLGWAAAARVVCADVRTLWSSDALLLARATGSSGLRLLRWHIVPRLAPVLWAQFWISIPVFILSEANLSILGLGVAEPLPSWGSLLRELESFPAFRTHPWHLAPLLLLVATVSCFHFALQNQESWA